MGASSLEFPVPFIVTNRLPQNKADLGLPKNYIAAIRKLTRSMLPDYNGSMKKTLLLLVGVVFLLPQPAIGCTIPVFRYALEKWELATHEIVVFHKGALPEDVGKAWSKTPIKANVDFTLVDLDGTVDAKMQKLWAKEGKDAKTPWMFVRYPIPRQESMILWAGPCTKENVLAVLDSPKRQEILGHLKRGVSSVFVLLTSGDEKADKAVHDMALKELQSLEKKIKLPEQSKDGPQIKLPLPLKVELPIVVVDRSRPEEAAFIKMLLMTDEDLDKVKSPMLFPIFGRGRILGSLVNTADRGNELTEKQVMEVTKFLCRECSCQVKDLNPGVDMLLAANWEEIFNKMFADEKDAKPGEKKLELKKPAPTEKVQPKAPASPAAKVKPDALTAFRQQKQQPRLELKNFIPRVGAKGTILKDAKIKQGELLFFTFDIEGLVVDPKTKKRTCQFEGSMSDSKRRVLFRTSSMSEFEFDGKDGGVSTFFSFDIPADLAPGPYSVQLTMRDQLSPRGGIAFEYKFDVLKK
jgi:hypothetical protein